MGGWSASPGGHRAGVDTGNVPAVPRRRVRRWSLAGAVLAIPVAAVLLDGTGSSPPALQVANVRSSGSLSASASPTRVATTAPSARGRVTGESTAALLDVSGTGAVNTQPFRAPDGWDLLYRYRCGDGPQYFAVSVEGDLSDLPVNEMSRSGAGLVAEHRGGTVHLSVNSACTWRLTAVDPTGAARPTPVPEAGGSLLDVSGSGAALTRSFRAPGRWMVRYRFDCGDVPSNLAVQVQGDSEDVAVNQIGSAGSGTSYEYGGGRVALAVDSTCHWHVTALALG